MENKSLSLMTVDETYEFVSNTLEFPELAEKFKGLDLRVLYPTLMQKSTKSS